MSSCTVYNNALFADLVTEEAFNRSRAASRIDDREGSVRSAARGSSNFEHGSSGHPGSGLRSQRSSSTLRTRKSPSPDRLTPKGHGDSLHKRRMEAKKVLRNKTYWLEQERLQAESERQVREKIERAAVKKEAQFQRMYHGLTQGVDFTDSIEHMLEMQEEQDRRKQQSLFNEWSEKVFDPIQRKISDSINRQDRRAVGQMRRAEYEKFLESTNQKSSLFLDIIIESDYDPFVLNRNCISYKVKSSDDPTKRMLTRCQEEKSMVPGASNAKQAENEAGRDTLDVLMWGTGKIECTPYGHFSKMLEVHKDEKKLSTYRTNFVLDHYSFPKGKACVDAELPKGKRTDFSALGIKAMR